MDMYVHFSRGVGQVTGVELDSWAPGGDSLLVHAGHPSAPRGGCEPLASSSRARLKLCLCNLQGSFCFTVSPGPSSVEWMIQRGSVSLGCEVVVLVCSRVLADCDPEQGGWGGGNGRLCVLWEMGKQQSWLP